MKIYLLIFLISFKIIIGLNNLQSNGAITLISQKACAIGGCNNEICGLNTGNPIISPCIYKDEYACYKNATCQYNVIPLDCGWVQTSQLISCLKNTQPRCIRSCNDLCIEDYNQPAIECLPPVGWLNCYKNSTCQRQNNGRCGWTNDATVQTCLNQQDINYNSTNSGCKIGGCSGELCGLDNGEGLVSSCIYKPEYSCYKNATCAKTGTTCGWIQTDALSNCIANTKIKKCVVSGCSGELCVEDSLSRQANVCWYKNEFKCYKNATCAIQTDNTCDWNQTDDLNKCINDARNTTT